VVGKGRFESGVETKVVSDSAEDPFPYLDPETKTKMTAARAALLWKFTESPFDGPAQIRWQLSSPTGADDCDAVPATGMELQNDLLELPGDPFLSACFTFFVYFVFLACPKSLLSI